MSDYRSIYNQWLTSNQLSDEEKQELLAIENDPDEILLRFSKQLDFGTAGLRGKMMTGTNAINRHTIAHATQGLAALILREGRADDGVAIAYDCRIDSDLFAKTTAAVLAANGIKVYLFDGLRPTPELSFALRALHCVAGVNITASHNPKQYNGYKAYWEDGAQLSPEQAAVVSEEIARLDIFNDVQTVPFDSAVADGRITLIGKELDELYLEQVLQQAVDRNAIAAVADELKIVYTPLHGTGHILVPEALRRAGLKHLYAVEEQMVIDGSFPTVEKPNPEYPEVFESGIRLANEVGSDLVIATDPDADRVGVMTRCANGSFVTISGNQMGALLLDYIITAYRETDTMPPEPYAVKSIVSSELATKVCEANGVKVHNVLTGFKFIGEVIKRHELLGRGSFLFGFEESYGYLKGTYARDKDAVVTSMLICEMTAHYKALGMTLADALAKLWEKYGYCFESTRELYMEGVHGGSRMAALMNALRQTPPTEFSGSAVSVLTDYLKQTAVSNGNVSSTGLPSSNVLSFRLENGDVIVVRPSGTEPKVKFYYLLQAEGRAEAEQKLEAYVQVIRRYIPAES